MWRSRTRTGAAVVLTAALCAIQVDAASADLPPGADHTQTISNFGRLIDPIGMLTQVGYFPTGAALTPDGRFVWTVAAGRRDNDIQISDAATGQVVQDIANPGHGKDGGIAIAHDGRRAYVSDTGDEINVYDIDPTSGRAVAEQPIPVPPPQGTPPPDNFPPSPPNSPGRSYPAGLALTADDATLVAALNLDDRAAIIDTRTRAVAQVKVRSDSTTGDHAYPQAVAIAGSRAFIADEGDGTIASFDIANPNRVNRSTPAFNDPSGLNPKRTHPSAIIAAHDGRTLFVSLTSDDQVLALDAENPSRVLRSFDARRADGVGTQPVGLALTPDERTLLVANVGEDVVRSFALARRQVVLPPGGFLPVGFAGSRRGSQARGSSNLLGLPSSRGCKDRRRFAFRLHPPRGVRIVRASIYVNGHRVQRLRGRRITHIVLRRLPKRRFTVRIVAITSRGQRIVSTRTYRACRKGRPRRLRPHRRARVRPHPGSRRASAASGHVVAAAGHGSAAAGHASAAAGRARAAQGRAKVADGGVVTIEPGQELARIPVGIYPRQVMVAPGGQRLVVVDSKGVGPGSTYDAGESVSVHVLGTVERIPLPAGESARDTALVRAGQRGLGVPVPADAGAQPSGSPLVGPGGGASDRIKYVFYVVTENKTYDSVLGDLERGNGDPCLAIFGETRSERHHPDGSACPQNRYGVSDADIRVNPGQRYDNTPLTPNEHRVSRDFVALDNTAANSETSDDGHIWTSSAYAPDYDLRVTQGQDLTPHPFDLLYPVSAPPKGFFFDSAVRQGIGFFNYGEAAAGLALPDTQATAEEQSVRSRVLANSEFVTQYPSSGAIDVDPVTRRETLDHDPGPLLDPIRQVSRMHYFRERFNAQLAACRDPSQPASCSVPQYNEMLFPNNHTAGTTPGRRTPDALVRDTDQAIGQLVSDVSHSKIWPYSAIFVVQDDAQSGADHVEGHRITSLVASPYARRGAVVSTHYDSVSVIRTIELILGMRPTYLYDALARPMWEAFRPQPDNTPFAPYDIPAPLTDERNGTGAGGLPLPPLAGLSKRFTWVADAVPQVAMNRIIWAYRYGTPAACPRRAGRVPYSPCGGSLADSAREIAKGRATQAALRRLARTRRTNGSAP
ncbi:MAG: hypothetical protein NVSMB25_16180 [Thermoleophilaceae bacterium]